MSNWVKGLRQFWLAAIICGILLALPSTVAHAQSFSIQSLPANATSNTSRPTMAGDSRGFIDVAWVDSTGIEFARSTDNGVTFSQPILIPSVGVTFQPQMIVNPQQPDSIEISWPALDPASPSTAPTYDVFASRANAPAPVFTVTQNLAGAGGVPLYDSPRLAFDTSNGVNIVWGQFGAWISHAPDGLAFSAPVNLAPSTPAIDTGGPRVASDNLGDIFVVWTDVANQNTAGSYCIPGTPDTVTVGGHFFVNETLAGHQIDPNNTRDLSTTDWVASSDPRFPNGFFGCSRDNLTLFEDNLGQIHLLWSDEKPIEDILTSKPTRTHNANNFATFAFPINLANLAAASPRIVVDQSKNAPLQDGSYYFVWSGGPTGGGFTQGATNSQGIFFRRSDDGGDTFTPTINIASSSAFAPAYPQISVDSKGNVSVAWEPAHKAIAGDGSDMF